MNAPATKPGQYGTLYRYAVTYTDPSDFAIGELVQRVWAYSIEHALDIFYGAEDSDGWKALRVARVLASASQHRAIQHKVA